MAEAFSLPQLSNDSITTYMQAISEIPLLSAEEENRLATKLHDEGCVESARALIVSHLRFVAHIARGYSGYGLPFADLVQEGNIGLMKAVRRFNPGMGHRLTSFSVHWIKAEINEFVMKNWAIVKMATTKAQRKLFFNLRKLRKQAGNLNRSEARSIAEKLSVTEQDVMDMESRFYQRDVAFDALDSDEDNDFSAPAYTLADPLSNIERSIGETQHEEQQLLLLKDSLHSLDERSRDIIQHRWLNENKATLQELAGKHGVSQERIRQIESIALGKLKQKMLPHFDA